MSSQPQHGGLAWLAAAPLLLIAATPPEPLGYDPGVFLAGECLSPSLSGCGDGATTEVARRSASEALLDAAREPRLELDMAVLRDIGPELSGPAASGPALPR